MSELIKLLGIKREPLPDQLPRTSTDTYSSGGVAGGNGWHPDHPGDVKAAKGRHGIIKKEEQERKETEALDPGAPPPHPPNGGSGGGENWRSS